MPRFLLIAIIAGLVACNSTTAVEKEADTLGKKIDTLVKKVEDSETMDSIKSKGSRFLNSARSKSGRFVEKAADKLNDLKKKDSVK